MLTYKFDPQRCYARIYDDWKAYARRTGARKFIIGNSGGKDSAVCIFLAKGIFGKRNVIALSMPNVVQDDRCDAEEVAETAGVVRRTANIGGMFTALVEEWGNGAGSLEELSKDAKINLAPRLRMTALYFFGRQYGAFVVNTDNLDERLAGYFTLYGDGAGDYAPLRDLTVTEVLELGKWLGVPQKVLSKKPGDGLQPQGDEDRLGFSYADLDRFIRLNEGTDAFKDRILARYHANAYKTNMVDIPGPEMPYPNYVHHCGYIQNRLKNQ